MQYVWSGRCYKPEGLVGTWMYKREFVGVKKLTMDAIFLVGRDRSHIRDLLTQVFLGV
jgi:hypothetical protein